MADISVSPGKEIIIAGSDPVTYDKVAIKNLNFTYTEDGKIICDAYFRCYRLLEDESMDWAPLSSGTPFLSIPNLKDILVGIEGGAALKDAVAEAVIGIAKLQGII
jgi:hypothetical protein